MAGYGTTLQRTASTTASLGSLNAPAASMRRIRLYEFIFGSEATAADNIFLLTLGRVTTAGTSTSITPLPLDPADAACVAVSSENHTVEPTYTAASDLMQVGINQRATFRWVAVPGRELVIPATANNGIGFKTPTATAVVISASVYFDE